MKSKQVLSVEQMKHLQEIGLELRNTSMLLWYKQMLGKYLFQIGNYRFGVKAYLVKIMYTLLTLCRIFSISCLVLLVMKC